MEYITYAQSQELSSFLNENAVGAFGVLNEDAQLSASSAVLDKMLDLTISRYNKIDFSDIERSRGDATACKMYKNLRESIDIICDIDMKSDGKIPGAVVVSTALNNLVTMKQNFMYGFRTKNSLAIILYNTIYYSIIEATSYLIATSIDFAKSASGKIEYKAYSINNRDTVLINNLAKFNKKVADGHVAKFINVAHDTEVEFNANEDAVLTEAGGFFETSLGVIRKILGKFVKVEKDSETGTEFKKLTKAGKLVVGVASAAALIYILSHIVPIIQSCIYVIYRLRHKISESAKIQAELIEMNIEVLKEQGADEDVIKKQEKAAARFRAIADKFALDVDKSNRDAKKDANTDKVDATEVII